MAQWNHSVCSRLSMAGDFSDVCTAECNIYSILLKSRLILHLFRIRALTISAHSIASNPTTHRLEQNWQYTNAVGF
jgi:hypothetical protein